MAKQKDNKQYLTQEGFDKLLVEKADLIDNKLPATLERLKEAISQGDISENAEYDTAMSEKELIEGRIKEIEGMVINVEIIKHSTKGGDVKYGSIVKIEDDKKRSYTYTVVGTGEVNVLEGTISLESPMGIAINGKKKGDTVTVKAPSRKYDVKIISVK